MVQDILVNNVRVQFLSREIVRVEYASDGAFYDADSLFIPARKAFAGWDGYTVRREKKQTAIAFDGCELVLPAPQKGLEGVLLRRGEEVLYAFGNEKNTGELPPLHKTPAVWAVADTPRITPPKGGYSAQRRGEFAVEEGVQDVYLLLCNGDFKALRRLYVALTGRTPIPRLSTFGAWNSKYFRYDEESAKKVILDYEKYGIPLDNMVLDTDWRAASDRGIGYDIDTALFPDIGRFFAFAHEHGVEIMFNDHPEPVEGAKDLFSPEEIAFREEKLQGLLRLGLDTWWYDRNWSTKLKSPTPNVRPETFGMYIFEEITRHFYEKQAGSADARRPVLMANVNEVANGCYMGIKDSASHRFGIQWTGDIPSNDISLAAEVETLLRASESAIAYVNADLGGHLGNPDKELYLRWIEFGALSPVFRPHCTNTVERFREPWCYDEETVAVTREYVKMRYRLLPVIYSAAYENYLTGAPLFRRLGWEYPDDARALACRDEYLLGKNILVSPVAGLSPHPLDAEDYCAPVTAVYFNGRKCEGEPLARTQYKTLDLWLDNEPPMEGLPVYEYSARFETQVCFTEDTALFLSCDDGATVYVDGKCVLSDDTIHSTMTFPLGAVRGGEVHTVRVDYFQAGGEASCRLCRAPVVQTEEKTVYLPAGRWLDVFGKEVHVGEHKERFAADVLPLYVRLGALLPLAYDAKNTREQTWDKLTFDFYPDKSARDEGVLYEDDGETCAYLHGAFRTTAYSAAFDAAEGAFVVRIGAAEGVFGGPRAYTEQACSVRFHCLGERVVRVTLNGGELPCSAIGKGNAFPFAAEGAAREGDVVQAAFTRHIGEGYELKFYIA